MPSADNSISPDMSSEVSSSLHLNTSLLTSTPFYRHFPLTPETSVHDERIRGVQEFLAQEGERAISNISLGAKQQTEHAITLKKLAKEEYAHRSRSDTDRAQRRSSLHTSVAPIQLPAPPKPVTRCVCGCYFPRVLLYDAWCWWRLVEG